MASPSDSISMALFCDFENVALGVRDAQYEKFDIKPILERLLLKGSIVVKKAYCDWERYKGFKATMHEANFELIEIPHVRQSGKNSADIRLVVDALDLCYTKSHVNTFVIISGDSDFSPLVSKLRENNKQVIGVGVKQSTSDLLIANCDEFIFYDDLVRENQRAQARRQSPGSNPPPAPRRSPEEERSRKESQDARRTQGVELAAETFEALLSERGDTGKIWASVLKEAIKRRKPDFSEGRYGFRTFGNLLEEAQARGLLEFGRDEKSGAYVYRSHGQSTGAAAPARSEAGSERVPQGASVRHDFHAVATAPDLPTGGSDGQGPAGRSRGRRSEGVDRADMRNAPRSESHEPEQADAPAERPASRYFSQPVAAEVAPLPDAFPEADDGASPPAGLAPAEPDGVDAAAPRRSRARSKGDSSSGNSAGGAGRKTAAPRARGARAVADASDAAGSQPSATAAPEPTAPDAEGAAPTKPSAARPRSRTRKPADKPAE
ncbi:NYN domain-containing protein [Acidovorax sp. ACV01]|uniref:NYN domain-containing protein n=1 Tax=Acidovorax sp. ACV01 TaxID=2769311 RepID=UPI0017871AD9|nr:NYN domain-containing protein [Acidovorax sp. ACV01]MBD9395399.1 NYN domain-containing protein [Acidovorax sp. ACV01]